MSVSASVHRESVVHGSRDLPGVTVDSYNLELRGDDGFLGDDASETAFRALLDDWREAAGEAGIDPLGHEPTENIGREELDRKLEDDAEAAEVLTGAIDHFSEEFARVLGAFLRTPEWAGVERIVCGGGLQESRIGAKVVARTQALAKRRGLEVAIRQLRYDPDDGGMIGWAHAAPADVLDAGEAFLAADIGGTNARCGVVMLNRKAAPDFSQASVESREKWCHADDAPGTSEETVDGIAGMLKQLADAAERRGIRLAPFVGLSCPGIICADGRIDRGAQNLPGDWTAQDFHLPDMIGERLPEMGGRRATVAMHNDAVMQGLSEVPWMRDVRRWAAVTIGTGLGNCSFTNRRG